MNAFARYLAKRRLITKLASWTTGPSVPHTRAAITSDRKGEYPQGVGFRKKVFPATATNVPQTGEVILQNPQYASNKAALARASNAVRKEKGWGLTSTPLKGLGRSTHTSFTKKELDDLTDLQGYGDYLKRRGITPSPGSEFYPPRYGLKHRPAGPDPVRRQSMPESWSGYLTDRQVRQLKGKEPMYKDQYEKSSMNVPEFLRMKPAWAPKGGVNYSPAPTAHGARALKRKPKPPTPTGPGGQLDFRMTK